MKKLSIVLSALTLGMITAQAQASTLVYKCSLGSQGTTFRPRAWQYMEKTFTIVDGYGTLKMEMGDVVATAHASPQSPDTSLLTLQLEDKIKNVRSSSTVLTGTAYASSDLYNDHEFVDVVGGQLSCQL